MDSSWIVIIAMAIILILFSLVRRRGGPAKYPEIIQSLLYDIKYNQALSQAFPSLEKPRHFNDSNWQFNKSKIGFLGESTKQKLKELFGMAAEFNLQIKECKRNRSDSYRSIDLTRFKELLAQCREDLENWMIEKVGSKELPMKYPTLGDFFFGSR